MAHQDTEARRAYQKAWNEKNKEKLKAQRQAYYQANKARWKQDNGGWKRANADVERRREVARNYYYRNRDKVAERTKAKRDAERRVGECPICNRPGVQLVWDHDHGSGEHRGWICSPCNLLLGHSYDNTRTLERAIAYLKGDLDVVSEG